MINLIHRRARGLLAFSLAFGLAVENVKSQSRFDARTPSVLLEATGSQWLHSASLDLGSGSDLPSSGTDRRFECRFGFSTDEVFVEGLLADMISAVLLDSAGRHSMVLFTLSAEGLSLMPLTADSLSVNLDQVVLEETIVPPAEAGLSTRFAYRIQTPLPSAFAPGNVRLALALYDNQDEAHSRAWLEDIVLVPEPSGLAIVVLAWATLIGRRLAKARQG